MEWAGLTDGVGRLSRTTSLSESIYNYRREHGRTYHGEWRAGWEMPGDAPPARLTGPWQATKTESTSFPTTRWAASECRFAPCQTFCGTSGRDIVGDTDRIVPTARGRPAGSAASSLPHHIRQQTLFCAAAEPTAVSGRRHGHGHLGHGFRWVTGRLGNPVVIRIRSWSD